MLWFCEAWKTRSRTWSKSRSHNPSETQSETQSKIQSEVQSNIRPASDPTHLFYVVVLWGLGCLYVSWCFHHQCLSHALITGSCFRCFHIFSHAVLFQNGNTGGFLYYYISSVSQILMTICRGDSDFVKSKMWGICNNEQADSKSKLCFILPFLYILYTQYIGLTCTSFDTALTCEGPQQQQGHYMLWRPVKSSRYDVFFFKYEI